MKNSNDTIGNRARDLPAQQTAAPLAPLNLEVHKITTKVEKVNETLR